MNRLRAFKNFWEGIIGLLRDTSLLWLEKQSKLLVISDSFRTL